MKTMKMIFLVVLLVGSTFAFAGETDTAKSALAVVESTPGIFKLIYKGEKVGLVDLKIYDEAGVLILKKNLGMQLGFMIPLNFNGMSYGSYEVRVMQDEEMSKAAIKYELKVPAAPIVMVKPVSDQKYAVILPSTKKQTVKVEIFDARNELVDTYQETVSAGFAKIFNMSNVSPGSYTFVVSNSSGAYESVTF